MDNTTLMTNWLLMWNENPALARDLMTGDCRQWSGLTPGLDSVVGPEDQVRFVTAYRAKHVNMFRPRVLVDGGDQFAYLWDVTLPDGTVWTGADANIVRGGRVSRNWTFVSDSRSAGRDPGPADAQPAGAAALDDVCRAWISLWTPGSASSQVDEIVTDDVAAYLWAGAPAKDLRGAPALADELARLGKDEASPTRAIHRQPVLDPERGRAALLWRSLATGAGTSEGDGEAHIGGLDILNVRDGRVSRAWSLAGRRDFPY